VTAASGADLFGKLTDIAVHCIHGDKGCRGQNYPDRFKVGIVVGSVVSPKPSAARGVAAPVIGHFMDDHRMCHNHPKGRNATASTPSSPRPASDGSGAYCAACC
jgi:hypothetical protein